MKSFPYRTDIVPRPWRQLGATALVVLLLSATALALDDAPIKQFIDRNCLDCHDAETQEGGLDLTALEWSLTDSKIRNQWIKVFDRVDQGEMPPEEVSVPKEERRVFTDRLGKSIRTADLAEVTQHGRGPLRRLNRSEYEQNLRDLLQLPNLDVRDILPEDRQGHHFNKTAATLDMSRVQLVAHLEATDVALRAATASGLEPPPVTKFQAVGRKLFSVTNTFGNRQAMFFARDSKALDNKELEKSPHDPNIELALFRSAHWPYYGYPQAFLAQLPGQYRVRFSARAVLQQPGFKLTRAVMPVPMTFRARKRSGPDVSGDVRATGGLIDVQPKLAEYETVIQLRAKETFEYSLLGLPVPLARNVKGGPPTYRYPPFPKAGQPGVAFQWLTVEGPLSPATWPPPSHRVLFDDLPFGKAKRGSELPVEVVSAEPQKDAVRLLRRFIGLAARQLVPPESVKKYEQLILTRLNQGAPFAEAMLVGYKAFLCSAHFLYLTEPETKGDHFPIASRFSHFLSNTRPDGQLARRAAAKSLRDTAVLRAETDRLIASPGFDRFVQNFTDYWLDLRHIHRDDPDVRLHPEYRFDDYLVESMERETRAFFKAMLKDNLPITVIVDSDFVFANDRLALHYGLPAMSGSDMRKVALPNDSPYGGLLTQGAIMKVTSNGTTTSPVVRGAWIMDRLIGQPPPAPPTSVPAVKPDIRGATTIREILALHTKSKDCAGCHARFDPVGLALENFDILGGWRTQYRGLEKGKRVSGIDRAGHDFAYTLAEPVDASGELRDGRKFENVYQLKQLLASRPRQLAENLLKSWTLYATGTPVRFSDRAEIETMLDACADDGYRARDLLHALIASRVFLGSAGSTSGTQP